MSIPTLTEFNPNLIPWQYSVLNNVYGFNYSLGVHEVLLSGSVGSAKSLELCHFIVRHCLENEKAHVLIGRASMPHLRDTLFQMILDHLGDELPYVVNQSRASITFPHNGSKISSWSWSDKKYKKVRSYALSMAVVEELTENDQDEFYKELKMRVGRIPHIKTNLILCATNPDSPAHWAYKYFVKKRLPTRHVYYSLTSDNPFLPQTYIDGIKETLSEKEVQRMLYGQWIEIASEMVYYNYSTEVNYVSTGFKIDARYPLDLFFDFNIGYGKPMSCGFGQVVYDVFKCYRSFIVEGANTEDILDEMAKSGVFELPLKFRVYGDASGRNRDTRSNKTDYDIIYSFLNKYKRTKDNSSLEFEMEVPKANPPVRERHNYANGVFKNSKGLVKFLCYDDNSDEGLRLTKLKKGSGYIEDDSFKYQHITTAITYWIHRVQKQKLTKRATRTIIL